MDSNTPKPNVQELQRQVIALLEQVSALMSRASTKLWFEDGSESKYETYKQEVDKERRTVENLELRMAIAAPMNAGKSTIINAIIGQELLPSCATAMTTLPTEIVFKANSTEPILNLNSQKILPAFQEAFLALKQKIDEQGIDQVLKETAEYPHLEDLLKRIHNRADFPVSAEISGSKEINRLLTDLNYVIRLCSILGLCEDPLQSITDIPRIETPFWRWQENEEPEKLGNLVIIDTPGPNEAGVSSKLESEVSKQLKKSQLVLIVLDFTGLKAEAAEKIKEEVQKVIRSRGRKNLYVLVNKVDQRSKGDMDTEQVRQFVANNLKLVDAEDTERVFEISARQAFRSTDFLRESRQCSDYKASELKTAEALAQAVWSIDWEEELEEATLKKLQKKAEKLWQNSGFEPFLEEAISTIMAQVAPRCMEAALNLCLVRLKQLCESVRSRRNGIHSEAQKLKQAINELNNELYNLQLCRESLDEEVAEIKKQIDRNVNENLEKLKVNVREQLNRLLIDRAIESFKNLFSQFFKKILSKDKGEFEFESQEDAKTFASRVANSTRHIIEKQLNDVCKDTEEQTKKLIKNLSNLLENRTKPIIKRAQTRLIKDFDVSLNLDPLKVADVYVKINEPEHESKSSGYSNYNFYEFINELFDDLFSSTFSFIVLNNPLVKVIKAGIMVLASFFGYQQKEKGKYTIELFPYIEKVIELIEDKVEDIKGEAKNYIEGYFKQKVDLYFKALDSYLGDYRNDLEQSLKDKKLPARDIEELKQALESFATGSDRSSIDKLIDQANTLLESTNQLLPQR